MLQVEAKQLGHCSESMVIKLYGRFRVNTAALANVESVATSGGAIRRPSAAARQAAQPGEDGRAAADTSVPRDMSAATPRTVETTGASLDPSASG
ncbi:hypothetical protein [Gemmatimonas sp.]|uniref:hypothetical protein n=1 Tax=Gemmatimonas sp. TaxID=1962908 RepID=UPI00286E4E3B|nr:hypothetical protein [Gemmatimonas sp.]